MGIVTARSSPRNFLMRVYSSTGFLLQYDVTVKDAELYFNQEGGEQPPPGWLFRRVLRRVGDTEFSETVQVAPPERPFFDDYAAKLTRVTARKQAATERSLEQAPRPNPQPPKP
jgi:hypothetical protein